MRILSLLALLAFLSAPIVAQDVDFPNPPNGQILDTGSWLAEEDNLELETELGRLRREYGVDVIVVVWSRAIPAESTLEDLARRIGEAWGREGLWAVVLHVPDSLQNPAVATGGSIAEGLKAEALEAAVQEGTARGLKERTIPEQVKFTSLEVAEELVFLLNRRNLEEVGIRAKQQESSDQRKVRNSRIIVLAVVVSLLSLGALGSVAYFFLRHRRPTEFTFPDTRWRKRFGGEWSGGSTIAVSLPNKP